MEQKGGSDRRRGGEVAGGGGLGTLGQGREEVVHGVCLLFMIEEERKQHERDREEPEGGR